MIKRSVSDQTLSQSSEESRLEFLVQKHDQDGGDGLEPLSPDIKESIDLNNNISNNTTTVASVITTTTTPTTTMNNEIFNNKKTVDGFLVPDLPASLMKKLDSIDNSIAAQSKSDKFKVKSKLTSRSTSNIFKGLEAEVPIVVQEPSSPSKKKYGSVGNTPIESATVGKKTGKSVSKSVSNFFMKKSTSRDNLYDDSNGNGSNQSSPELLNNIPLSTSNGSINSLSSAGSFGTIKKKDDSFKSKFDSFFKSTKSSSSSFLKQSNDYSTPTTTQTLVPTSTLPGNNSEILNSITSITVTGGSSMGGDDDIRQSDISDYSDDYDSDFDDDDVDGFNLITATSTIGHNIRRKHAVIPRNKHHRRSESNQSNKSASSIDLMNALNNHNTAAASSAASSNNPSTTPPLPLPQQSQSEPTLATFTNIDTGDLDSEDTKKLLERRLQRRPTVHELNVDNILSQNDFEDVAIAQKQIEIKNQKLFVGTRPTKKVLFYSPIGFGNNTTDNSSSKNSIIKIDEEDQSGTTSSFVPPQLTRLLNSNSISNSFDPESLGICMLLVASCNGWKREFDLESDQQPQLKPPIQIEEIENEFPHYLESFCKDKHKNYYAFDPNFIPPPVTASPSCNAETADQIGPVVISIKREAERTPNYRKLKKKKDKSKTVNNSNNNNNNSNSNNNNTSIIITQEPTTMESMERKFKTIIRTREGEDRFYLSSGKASPRELINTIKSFFLPQFSEMTFKKLPNNSESRKLLQYWESAQMSKEYKFGLLYRKNKQVNENDFFSNQDESKEYSEFLEFIGQKIKLKGWDQYKGGLDIKNDTTGLHSVYTSKEVTINDNSKIKFQIMFHVSTLLPFYPNDVQQLERKRHIGNDIVVLIFQDTNTTPPFSPSMIKSEFNHVFVVVQPLKKESEEEATKYSVTVTFKDGVSNFGPVFSSSKIWKKDSVFLDYLLTKLINAEKASYYSHAFYDKMKRTRLNLLMNIVNTFQKEKE